MAATTRSSPRSPGLYALVTLLLAQGASGVFGGASLVRDPSGIALGLPIDLLRGSLFPDYRIPGLVLLVGLGIAPLLVAWGVWTNRRWSRTGSLLVAGGLLVWLAVQIAVIGYQHDPPLQLVYGLVGLGILLLSLRSPLSVRDRPPPRDGEP